MIERILLSLIGNSADSISFQRRSVVVVVVLRRLRSSDEEAMRKQSCSSNREVLMKTDMNYRGNSILTAKNQSRKHQELSSPFKFFLNVLTHYESKTSLLKVLRVFSREDGVV